MASSTQIRKTRKAIKARKMGRKRKHLLVRQGSTPPAAVLFGDPQK
jgi:hypothetical protein